MKLEDLPRFTVNKIRELTPGEQEIGGIFDRMEHVREGMSWLYSETDSFYVELVRLDRDTKTGVLRFQPDEEVIRPGETFIWFDAYYNASLIRKIVAEGYPWVRTEFQAEDAVSFIQDGIYGWTKAVNGVPRDAEPAGIIPEGWEHEHCSLCWATIGRGGEPIGYVDEEDDWLCPECYHRYAETHDLSFMAWGEG